MSVCAVSSRTGDFWDTSLVCSVRNIRLASGLKQALIILDEIVNVGKSVVAGDDRIGPSRCDRMFNPFGVGEGRNQIISIRMSSAATDSEVVGVEAVRPSDRAAPDTLASVWELALPFRIVARTCAHRE